MILVFKRSNLIILAVSFFMAVSVANMVNRAEISPASALPTVSKVVVIDPGHGASDGGAVGSTGVPEKEINLSIARKLRAIMEKSGAVVVLTRTDDTPIADSKKADMRKRKSIKDNAGADIFVSIHINKFTESKYTGAQVFYAPDEESKLLGEAIQSSMISNLNPDNNRVAKNAGDSIYVLRSSTVPSVLVECGFLSNPQEEHLLTTPEYQEKVAQSIYHGIEAYFNTNR